MDKLEMEKTINEIIEDLFADSQEPMEKAEEVEAEEELEKAKNMEGSTPAKADDVKVDEKEVVETDRADFPAQINSFDEKSGKIKDKDYSAVQEKGKEEENKEANQVAPVMKKAIEISEEDYEILQKAKKAQEDEELKKAKEVQMDMLKSVVSEAISGLKAENEELKKSLAETHEIIKKIASQPKEPKAITDVLDPIQKSQEEKVEEKEESLSKAEMCQIAEELALNKSIGEFGIEHATEVERSFRYKEIPNGWIMDPNARRAFQEAIAKKKTGK